MNIRIHVKTYTKKSFLMLFDYSSETYHRQEPINFSYIEHSFYIESEKKIAVYFRSNLKGITFSNIECYKQLIYLGKSFRFLFIFSKLQNFGFEL